MWLEELVEDSPFLRLLRDEWVAHGQVRGAQAMLRQVALARFPALTEADLAPLAAISKLDHLHALVPVLLGTSDIDAFRRALQDAQA
ncbi:MAG TPA: hypothetical protein VIG30_01125 [Ktedonobacterales bacterium]